jgi:hypothetical protein
MTKSQARFESYDEATHAVVATVKVDDVEAARSALQAMRLAVVPRAPGIVAAYWLEPIDQVGMSVIVFESEEHARTALEYPLPALPGVAAIEVQVREVLASA